MLPISEKGYAQVAAREACVLSAYPDTHMLAVGFGQNDPALKPGDTITLDQAIALFLKEGQRIQVFMEKTFAFVDLQQQHVDALFSVIYNVGTGTVRDSVDLIKAIAASRSAPSDKQLRDAAALEIIKAHPKNKPVPFNLSRRMREASIFASGDYGDLSKLMLWEAGKSPKNTPPDLPSIVPMPTFLKG